MTTLYDSLFESALVERERRAGGRDLISREELPPEVNRMGVMRWYLHPLLDAPSTRALYFHELEIPTGSRSGKLLHQGGIVHYVLEGSGHTVVDGVRHEWEDGDVVVIPIRENGSVYQHFNDSAGPVRMLVTWPNLDSALSSEAGVAMEVLEPAPEYVDNGS
jgi:quercetin dioxygenase-like cupin family protein